MTLGRHWHRHLWTNRLQSLLLILVLLAISGLTGALLFGEIGLWLALGGSLCALLFEPVATWRLTLDLYQAQPLYPYQAPILWQILTRLAERAELPSIPALYYIPNPVINAFAVGNKNQAAIALTEGLLRQLTQRELAGVLGHEIAHITNDDLRVMGLADYVSRLTGLFASAGQIMVVFSLPWLFLEDYSVHFNIFAILLLVFSPHLAVLAQMGLSRLREFDADLKAVELTGDPLGLAFALARIEQASRSWITLFLPEWGNPEPSWLRSHPATEERIKRLQTYAATDSGQFDSFGDLPLGYIVRPIRRTSFWRKHL